MLGRIPIPESISVYEMWHTARHEPDHELHKRLIAMGGRRSDASWYRRNDPPWSAQTLERIGEYIRHFTTLDADKWFELVASGRFPTEGPKAIEATRLFCAGQDIKPANSVELFW